MELICYEIQNDGAVGFEKENSTINLVVNQMGEESISFSPKRVILHNCSMRNLETISDDWNQYFSIFDSSDEKGVVIDSNKYQSIKITKKKD
jgi:hypothetical protein